MNARISAITLLLIGILALSSCSTQEEVTASNDKYMELYQSTYTNLRNALASTRATESFQGEVTREEIASINSLGILMSYDKARLIEIEASDVYQEMKAEGEIYLQEAKSRFLQNHSIPTYGKILSFT